MPNHREPDVQQWMVTEPFRSLPAAERERLAPHVEVIRAKKDDVLFQEGEPATWAYFVGSGRVQLRHLRADGGARTICQVGNGETFCCLPSLDGRPYPATATAATPVVLYRVPLAIFQEWVGRHPGFTAAVLHQFCGRLREFGCESCSSGGSAASRIAEKLLRVASHTGAMVPITRRELGEMAGTTVETAIRISKDFERAGWIKLARGRVRVLDEAALAGCARGEAAPSRTMPLRLVSAAGRRG